MRKKSSKRLYHVELKYQSGLTKTVKVKAASREVAEDRALKRNPAAIGINPSS